METELVSGGDGGDAPRKRIKGRSPSYPGIALETAIQRAKKLYEIEKQHPTPIGVVTKHWGYANHTTGPASVTYAALIKYGLLGDEGSGDKRVATLSDLAVTILMSPDPAERQKAIAAAALNPSIHAEMWEQYGRDLPSDDALRYKMAIQGPFTESGFDDFIRVYRRTIDFAKLESAEKITEPESEKTPTDDLQEEKDGGKQQPDPPADPGARRTIKRVRVNDGATQTFAVPMIGGASPVIIEGEFPLSEDGWSYFMTVLAAMKQGLVRDSEPTPGDE